MGTKRTIGMVLGVTVVAVMVLGEPGSAQETPPAMHLDKDEVVQDEPFTLSSVDPCAFGGVSGVLLYGVIDDWNGGYITDFETVPDAHGDWSVPLAVPTSVAPGKFVVKAVCYDSDPNNSGGVPLEFWYGEQTFVLGAKPPAATPSSPSRPATTPTTAAPAPSGGLRPATAVSGRPRFSG